MEVEEVNNEERVNLSKKDNLHISSFTISYNNAYKATLEVVPRVNKKSNKININLNFCQYIEALWVIYVAYSEETLLTFFFFFSPGK